MNFISEFLISLFEALGLYSTQNGLGEHLRGLDLSCNEYNNQSIYGMVFIYLFAVNTILVINYYYGFFNKIPWNVWWKWLINILLGAVILFVIAFMYSNNDYSTGNFCKDLNITTSDCFGFGLTAFIFSLLWSIILSLLIKWKSSINRKVPF